MTVRNNPRKGIRHETSQPPRYFFARPPTTSDKFDPATNKRYEVGSFAVIGKNPINGIPVASGTEGALYYLSEFNASGDAIWLMLSTGGGESVVTDLRDQVNAQVGPSVDGFIDIDGEVVANGANPSGIPLESVADAVNDTLKLQQQVSAGITGAPGDKNDAGISSYNDTQFVVDENGYVSLIGGEDQPVLQTITGDDDEPVGADEDGNINFQGSVVANGTNEKPLYFKGTPASSLQESEIQVSTTLSEAPSDKNNAGLSSYNEDHFTVTEHGYVSLVNSGTPPSGAEFSNLGMSYVSGTGTFTIHGYDGTALSPSNPAYIWLQSKTNPGQIVRHVIEANQDFIDDNGASEIIGALFGFTTSVAITVDVPFFVYAVTNNDQDDVKFMISRVQHRTTSPAAALIGDPSAPTQASDQISFFSLEDIIETNYDENPCLCIGSFRMRMSGSNDWTVQPLTVNDGFGRYQLETFFETPKGQFGANSGTWSIVISGTAPVFSNYTTNFYYFVAKRSSTIRGGFEMDGDGGVDGSGSVTARIAVPFNYDFKTTGSGQAWILSDTLDELFSCGRGTQGNDFVFRQSSSMSTLLRWNDFGDGDRKISGKYIHEIE